MFRTSSCRCCYAIVACVLFAMQVGCPLKLPPRDQHGLAIAARTEGGFWIAGEDGTDSASEMLLLGLDGNLAESSRTQITSIDPHFSCGFTFHYPKHEQAHSLLPLNNGHMLLGGVSRSINPLDTYTSLIELRPEGSVLSKNTVPEVPAGFIRLQEPDTFLLVDYNSLAASVRLSGGVNWVFESQGSEFRDALAIGNEVFLLSPVGLLDDRHTNLYQLDDQGALFREIRIGNLALVLEKFLVAGDGLFASVGYLYSGDQSSFCFTVFDAQGAILHLTEFPELDTTGFPQLAAVPGDGFLVLDSIRMAANGTNIVLIKVDDAGDEQWRRVYESNAIDVPAALIALPDGFAITGSTRSGANADSDVLLLITDADGTLLQRRVFGD